MKLTPDPGDRGRDPRPARRCPCCICSSCRCTSRKGPRLRSRAAAVHARPSRRTMPGYKVRPRRADNCPPRARSVAVAQQHANAHATPESRAVLKQARGPARPGLTWRSLPSRSERKPDNARMRQGNGAFGSGAGGQAATSRPTGRSKRSPIPTSVRPPRGGIGRVPAAIREHSRSPHYFRLAAGVGVAAGPDKRRRSEARLWQAVGLAQADQADEALAVRYLRAELLRIDASHRDAASPDAVLPRGESPWPKPSSIRKSCGSSPRA